MIALECYLNIYVIISMFHPNAESASFRMLLQAVASSSCSYNAASQHFSAPPAVRAWQEADGGDVLTVYTNLRASGYYTFTFLDYILRYKEE